MKFPPPPEPPTGGEEFLHQLADYYRALVEYHQRAATAAAQQVAHLESLLHPERLLDLSPDVPYWLTSESPTALGEEVNREAQAPPFQLPSVVLDKQGEQSEPDQSPPPIEVSQVLSLLLSAERGKMLHLDFIIRKLYGRLGEEQLPRLTAATRQLLEEGANQGKWSAVPDSPDCWTIDLKHFPDLAPGERNQPQPKQGFKTTLPESPKFRQYETMKQAIAACLEEHSPVPMTIQQVIDWFYPQGLSDKLRPKVYDSVSTGLSKGCNRLGWRRVSPGRYVWKQ